MSIESTILGEFLRYARTLALRDRAAPRTMGLMIRQAKRANTACTARHQSNVLGRSALTGTRVLRPASKGATVSVRQVIRALRTLSAGGPK